MTNARAAARRGAWRRVTADADEPFGWVAIADTEIRLAQHRHQGQADLLYHAFPLIRRPWWLPELAIVYRGYCRELLNRVASGQDTRDGTYAEIAVVCAWTTRDLKVPEAVAGLYHRAWTAAFPDELAYEGLDKAAAWYERDCGSDIDILQRDLRRRLRQPARHLPDEISCDGDHGTCRFAAVLP